MHGVSPSSGRRLRASRPQRIATSGVAAGDERADRLVGDRLPALVAVRARLARRDAQHAVQQQHAGVGPRRQVAVGRRRVAEVVAVLAEDVDEALRQRPHVRRDRERQADGDAPASGTDPARRSARARRASGRENARSTLPPAGRKLRPSARSARRKSPRSEIVPATGASASAQPGPSTSSSERCGAFTPVIVLRQRGALTFVSCEPWDDAAMQGPVAVVGNGVAGFACASRLGEQRRRRDDDRPRPAARSPAAVEARAGDGPAAAAGRRARSSRRRASATSTAASSTPTSTRHRLTIAPSCRRRPGRAGAGGDRVGHGPHLPAAAGCRHRDRARELDRRRHARAGRAADARTAAASS